VRDLDEEEAAPGERCRSPDLLPLELAIE